MQARGGPSLFAVTAREEHVMIPTDTLLSLTIGVIVAIMDGCQSRLT